MTLTQLNAFVLVARLGSVRAAAAALGVSESAVSQALTALRQDLGDQLITRSQAGMTLTPGGTRLLGTASQIVVLGAEAHAAVRAAQGAPEQLRVVATSTFAEFVAGPLMEAFRRRFAGAVEITTGVAAAGELGRADREPARRRRVRAGGDRRARAADRQRAHLQVPAGRGRPGGPRRRRGRAGPPGSGAGWSTRPAPTRTARRPGCCAGSASPTATSGSSRARPPPGRPPPTAPGSRPRSSTWCPTSCAAASCPSSTCRGSRSRSAGT